MLKCAAQRPSARRTLQPLSGSRSSSPEPLRLSLAAHFPPPAPGALCFLSLWVCHIRGVTRPHGACVSGVPPWRMALRATHAVASVSASLLCPFPGRCLFCLSAPVRMDARPWPAEQSAWHGS